MAFQKKQRAVSHDSRPQGSKLVMREEKVSHLKELNTPEARASLKKMNDKVYRGSRANLTNWYAPNGVHTAKGSSVKAERTNKVLRTKG